MDDEDNDEVGITKSLNMHSGELRTGKNGNDDDDDDDDVVQRVLVMMMMAMMMKMMKMMQGMGGEAPFTYNPFTYQ